jgi:CubicO group peptidase (beta-lactamase class C family)
MIVNQNRAALAPRGLGFAVGAGSGTCSCSDKTIGHSGATGTLAWADPATDTVCVVLTTLPGRSVNRHPRNVA